MWCQHLIALLYFYLPVFGEKNWDYLVFSQSWPVTECFSFECKPIPQPVDFVIHGLWPTKFPVENPTSCPTAPSFNESVVETILPDLERKWPNLRRKSHKTDFWSHEWSKHGLCALDDPLFPDQLSYFQKSLQLHERVSLLATLKSSGYRPNNDSIVQKEDISRVIQSKFGVRPTLTCFKHHHETAYLAEVRLCFDRDLNFRDCVEKKSGSLDNTNPLRSTIECPEEFILPSVYSTSLEWSLFTRILVGLIALFAWYVLTQILIHP